MSSTLSDEWKNFLERIGRDETTLDSELQENSSDLLELRLWASYRGQTLARTGMLIGQKIEQFVRIRAMQQR